jgi:hypothetical protein
MPLPVIAFCPYLPLTKPVAFADWEIGPVDAFDGRWSDPSFELQSKAFLGKFVDGFGKPIKKPSLVCRRGQKLDGRLPREHEIESLELAIAFAFLAGC